MNRLLFHCQFYIIKSDKLNSRGWSNSPFVLVYTMKDDKKKETRDKYLKNLKTLIKDVPDDGLVFLIKQAGILLHNAEAEKQNQAMLKEGESRRESNKSKPGSGGKTGKEEAGLKAKSQAKKNSDTGEYDPGDTIKLEKGMFGKSIIMTIAGKRKTFGEDEIIALVKLVKGSKTPTGGCHRLFEWLKQNRNDVLIDTGIKSKDSPLIKSIFETLKK